MDKFPRAPTGRTMEAEFHREVLQLLRERTPLKSDECPVDRRTDGFLIRPRKPVAAVVGSSFQRMIIKQIKSDWFNCYTYDSGGEHAVTDPNTGLPVYIKVAKPWELRWNPWHGSTMDGVTFSYATGSLNWARRKAVKASVTEFQIVVRPWFVGEVILAASNISGGTVAVDDSTPAVSITWQDINEAAHAWAQTDIPDPGDASL